MEKGEFGKIREAIEHNRGLAKKAPGEGGYNPKEKEWATYDSSLEHFQEDFYITLPESFLKDFYKRKREQKRPISSEGVFKEYIEETLSKEGKHDLTAIEFGGPGSRLFSGFTPNFFSKTVGVCLKDIRSENKKEYDQSHKHSIITGDTLDPIDTEVLTQVTTKLGKKSDLIISRMDGPLLSINKHPAILDRIIKNWYDMLNENGLMFIQFEYSPYSPRVIGSTPQMVDSWATAVTKKFPEIDVQVGKNVLRLHKKPGAPKELPPAKQLFSEE